MYDMHVILFFTRGVSLNLWDSIGMLSREVALYRKLQKSGVGVTFVTYGDKRELQYAERLNGIRICCNRWGLPRQLYEKFLPRLHKKSLKNADLIKTNQTDGADVALRTSRLWHKPFIVRCGYMWSEILSSRYGSDSSHTRNGLKVEAKVFNAGNRIVVTTDDMRANIIRRFPDLAKRISIIPNYVDTELFCPRDKKGIHTQNLCYVGRLDQKEKNLMSLVAAVQNLDVELNIIGSGPLMEELENEAESNPRLHLLGSIPNEKLPNHLRRYAAFVLPSFFEGHPKALIEAMSCGLPVIATNVKGINSIVAHGKTGWLCNTDAKSLREGILTVLSDPDLRKRLGKNAREYVLRHYSLDRAAKAELSIYQDILGKGTGKNV